MISADVSSSSIGCFLSGWSSWWPDEVTKKTKNQIIHFGFRFQCSWNTCKSPRTNILSSQAKLISCFLKGKSSGGSSGPISSVLFHHFLKFLFYNQTEWMDGDKKQDRILCLWMIRNEKEEVEVP